MDASGHLYREDSCCIITLMYDLGRRFYNVWIALFLAAMFILLSGGCAGPPGKPKTLPPPPVDRIAGQYVRSAQKMAVDGQFKSSNFFLRKAIEKFEQTERWADAIQCYIQIGDNFQSLDDNQQALGNLNHALDLTKEHLGYQPLELAKSFSKLAYKHLQNGEYDSALELYRKALGIQLELLGQHHPDVAKTYNSISLVYLNKKNPAEAQNNYIKSYSIKIRQFTGLPRNMSRKYRLMDQQVRKLRKGEFRKAREYFNRSIAAYLKLYGENNPLFSEIYEQIGMLCAFEKDYTNALNYLRKSLAIRLETHGDRSLEVAESYLNIGICLRLKGDYTDAFSAVHTALTIKEEKAGKYHPDTADAYYQIGRIYFQMTQWNKSLLYLQESLMALSPGFSDRRYIANPPVSEIQSKPQLLEIFITKARALKMRYIRRPERLEDLEASYLIYLRATELLETMRRGYKSESYKLYFNEKNHVIYQEAIQTSLLLFEMTRDQQYKVIAFLLSERSKAAVLAEALSESQARKFAGIPDSLLEQEKELKSQLTRYDTYLAQEYRKKDNPDALRIKKLEEQYYTLLARYGTIIDQFEKDYNKYYDLKYRSPVIDVPSLQKTLSRNEALLEYFIGDEILHIFVLTRNKLHVESIPLEKDLNHLVQSYYRSIKKIEEHNFRRLSSELYHLLVQPVHYLLEDKTKIIVIPDGSLYYVPFESLAAEAGNSNFVNLTRMNFLIRQFAISYHYSANLWLHSVNSSKWNEDKAFIGFAPIFGNGESDGYVLTHDPVNGNLRSSGPDQDQASPAFSQLPATEEEVRAIIHLFRNQQKKAAGYFHNKATENLFKTLDMTSFNLIHIATHSFEDTKAHKLSGLMFAPHNRSPATGEDGILYSGEIYNLQLEAELIVLSSCESGVGKLIKGEGMMALNRGFFYSGIRNIVFSLWKVEDRSTSQLMIEFYRNILEGRPYCRALRRAKLELLKSPYTAFPKYWSGFVLVGR